MGWFWRNFFALLLLATGLAQWITAAWLLVVLGGVALPWWLHLLVPVLLSQANRRLIATPMPGPGPLLKLRRFYTATVLACLFAMVALLAVAAFWAVVLLVLAALASLGIASAPGATIFGFTVLGTLALLGTLAAIAHGYTLGQSRVRVEKLRVPISGGVQALRVVQISDLHLGPFMDAAGIARHVRRVNSLEPDLICITGDITDGLDHAPTTFRALGRLEARLGVLCILGNHDFYTGADEVEEALRRYTPFTVLRDASTTLETGSGRLHVIGLDDRGPDWARGLRHDPVLERLRDELPEGEPVLLLNHRPDLFEHAERLGVDVVLAGHTHGGQLAFPLPGRRPLTLARFMTRYTRGTYRSGPTTLHVNLGLGMTGQPVRVASPREITLLTLVGKGELECASPTS